MRIGVVVVVLIVGIWSALRLTSLGGGSETLALGQFVDVEVVERDSSVEIALGSLPAGRCTYVVIADPKCSACRRSAEQWSREVAMGLVELPEEWAVLWVVLGGHDTDALELNIDGIRSLIATAPERVISRLGMTAVPWSAVLDQGGHLVSSSVGARLPTADKFQPDCTITPRASPARQQGQSWR